MRRAERRVQIKHREALPSKKGPANQDFYEIWGGKMKANCMKKSARWFF